MTSGADDFKFVDLSPSKDGFLTVIADSPILTGIFDGFSWIRCEGKGSFQNSPAVKEFGDARIAAGEKFLVVDLGACTGMDSTFMGSLAGMATRLSSKNNGVMQIAEAGARNQRSLEDLGLDFLMEIDPPAPVWHEGIEDVRAELHQQMAARQLGQIQRTKHVLEAHQELADMNDKNAKTFSNVVSMLETELEEKRKLAESQEKG